MTTKKNKGDVAMSTATIVPESTEYDIKTVVVKVRNSATSKLEFLRALAKKIANAISDGVAQTLAFARRVWTTMPASVSGALASGLMSTRAGYTFLTDAVRKTLSFVSNVFFKGLMITHNFIDTVGGQISHVVRKINEPAGLFLRNANASFTDLRMTAMDWAYRNLVGLGTILKAAFTSDITVRAVTGGSFAITAGIFGNLAFNGIVSAFASSVPYIGGMLVTALSGGLATILAIVGIANVAAGLSLVFNRDKVIASAVKNVEAKIVQATELQSEIMDLLGGEATVVVTGSTLEQAEAVATAHVAREVTELERSIKRDYPKARQGHHPKKSNKKN